MQKNASRYPLDGFTGTYDHMRENPSPLQQARIFAFLGTTRGQPTYLVFDSSFYLGAVAGGGVTSPGLSAPPGDGVGSGAGAGDGGGGAGTSFLSLQPANVIAKAKRATADRDTIFFIVVSSFPTKN